MLQEAEASQAERKLQANDLLRSGAYRSNLVDYLPHCLESVLQVGRAGEMRSIGNGSLLCVVHDELEKHRGIIEHRDGLRLVCNSGIKIIQTHAFPPRAVGQTDSTDYHYSFLYHTSGHNVIHHFYVLRFS